jgi:hypothetical protein
MSIALARDILIRYENRQRERGSPSPYERYAFPINERKKIFEVVFQQDPSYWLEQAEMLSERKFYSCVKRIVEIDVPKRIGRMLTDSPLSWTWGFITVLCVAGSGVYTLMEPGIQRQLAPFSAYFPPLLIHTVEKIMSCMFAVSGSPYPLILAVSLFILRSARPDIFLILRPILLPFFFLVTAPHNSVFFLAATAGGLFPYFEETIRAVGYFLQDRAGTAELELQREQKQRLYQHWVASYALLRVGQPA